MRVLLIDPWCFNGSNLYFYTTGLAEALSQKTELSVVTHKNCTLPQNARYKQYRVFFPRSEKMKRGKVRLVVRAIEYLVGYWKVFLMLNREKYDIVHIQWALMLKLDWLLFGIIKKKVKKVIYTAHNILPHSTGTKYVKDMRKIYDVVDRIIVHGEKMKNEFCCLYPEIHNKVAIQHMGVYMNYQTHSDKKSVGKELIKKVEGSERIYLYFGTIHEDKGLDRLIDVWSTIKKRKGSKLIIAGRIDDKYKRIFLAKKKKASKENDIVDIFEYVDDNTANYLLEKTDAVILPYRKGSMSAVVFVCAEFGNPVITTDFGVVSEYIENSKTGFICKNTDGDLKNTIQEVEDNITNEMLKEMGRKHQDYIYDNFSWDIIVRDLYNKVYLFNEVSSENEGL